VLTFALGLDLTGSGTISASGAEDAIRILGTVRGGDAAAGGSLTLNDINNAGADLTVETTQGDVILARDIADTTFTGTGTVTLANQVRMDAVTFDMDARAGSDNRTDYVYASGGLTVNDTLDVTADVYGTFFYPQGAQTLGGSGTGTLDALDTGDLIAVEGTMLADNGTLTVTDLAPVAGTGGRGRWPSDAEPEHGSDRQRHRLDRPVRQRR